MDAPVIAPGLDGVIGEPFLGVEVTGRVASARMESDQMLAAVAFLKAGRQGLGNFRILGRFQIEPIHPDQIGYVFVPAAKPAAIFAGVRLRENMLFLDECSGRSAGWHDGENQILATRDIEYTVDILEVRFVRRGRIPVEER